MNHAMKLLEAIGQLQDVYILEAHGETPKRILSRKVIVLIAAIIATMLLLGGCAAYAWHWYTAYFTQSRQAPLSDHQIAYIDGNTREYQLSQTYDGYTVALKSTISESYSAYVTFHLTAPEDVDFSSLFDPSSEERLSFRGLYAMPEGSSLPADLSYSVHDDADGKNNTLNVVVRIDPEGGAAAFGPGKTCEIAFKEIIKWGYDRDYAQELLSTKYAGQTDLMLEPEESSRLHPQTPLASGEWKFEVELESADTEALELLSVPLSARVLVVRNGVRENLTEESVEEVTLTSIQLHPLGASIFFEKPEPAEEFDCIYINPFQFSAPSAASAGETGAVFVMMEDGTRIGLYQAVGAKDTAILRADSPIILREVKYIQLSDGTKISFPAGTQH